MAIQLKRFDYDWERECSIKFNDYFEFPRELDMDPYTGIEHVMYSPCLLSCFVLFMLKVKWHIASS